MKVKYIILFLLLTAVSSYSSDFKLKLVFTEGESSKDSWESTTTVSIELGMINYTKTYSGYTKEKDVKKSGELTEDQINKLVEIIVNNRLNISDSLTDYTEKLNSNYDRYALINLTINLQGVSNVVKIEGDKKSLKPAPVYKSAMELIDAIDDIADSI